MNTTTQANAFPDQVPADQHAAPVFEPQNVPSPNPEIPPEEKKRIRKQYSTIGWGLVTLYAVLYIVGVIVVDSVLAAAAPRIIAWSAYYLFRNYVMLYLVGLPIMLLMLRSIPDKTVVLERKPVGTGRFLLFLFSGFSITYIINTIGLIIINIISAMMGAEASNPLVTAQQSTGPLIYPIFVVGIAPLVEEFIFRRLIFKKTAAYGPRLYMFFSAVTFALFHANLFQIFYAFVLGLMLTHLCWRMGGSIRQSWLLHFLLNLLGTVSMFLPNLGWQLTYVFGLMIAGIPCGIVLLRKLNREKKLRQPSADDIPSPPASLAFVNSGMIAYYIVIAALTVLSLLGG